MEWTWPRFLENLNRAPLELSSCNRYGSTPLSTTDERKLVLAAMGPYFAQRASGMQSNAMRHASLKPE
jgi:hypothetical protein